MIEFRWLEKRHPFGIIGDDGRCEEVHGYNAELILQYRLLSLGTDASGAITVAGSSGWGEWKDVPTVKG